MMEDNYTISDKYLSAVQEVVDWAIDCGLYVILNLHYDGGWLANFPTDKENCMEKYKRIWTQVSDAFADYSDYLVFESQNEELGWESLWNRWGGTEGKTDSYDLVNEINQTFVDIIRSSGGNNPQRHLLISGFKLPEVLTVEEIDRIISAVDRSKTEGQRNRAILETLYSCGLRVSELVTLKLSDLYFDEGFIKVEGKGSKQRLVPCGKKYFKRLLPLSL